MENLMTRLYSPELFEKFSNILTAELKEHLEKAQTAPFSVIRQKDPQELVREASRLLNEKSSVPENNTEILERGRVLVRTILESTTRLGSPHYMGHQVNPPVPFTGATTILGGVL